jgi:endogenous inhibitor of DNA gyrase (YacG/DUF329 family)
VDKNNRDNGNTLPCLYLGGTKCVFNLTFHIFGGFFLLQGLPSWHQQLKGLHGPVFWNVTRPGRGAFGLTPFTTKCACYPRPTRPLIVRSVPARMQPAWFNDYRVVCYLGAFAKLWELTVSCAMAGRPNVRMEQLRFCSTDCRKILLCGPLVKYAEKRKTVG